MASRKKPPIIPKRVEPRLFSGAGRGQKTALKPSSGLRRRRSIRGIILRFVASLVFAGVLTFLAVFGLIWLSLDRQGLLQIPDREPGILFLAADGSTLAEVGAFNGDDARIADLPDYVPNAFIAIEDRRFRVHLGIDPLGLLRAAYSNYLAGRVTQGGSTLTQQLAKNLFLNPDRTLERKMQEAVLAVWLETRFSKDDILQLYLNRVYFGSGATGIEKASQVYFSKSARDLTLREAAILAGLVKAPSAINPLANPEAAASRADLVLDSMVGAGFITQEEADAAASQSAVPHIDPVMSPRQFVVDWIFEQLPDFVRDYEQSLVVQTTVDTNLQALSELAVVDELRKEGEKLGVTEGAMVVMDGSGAVLAMVGGKSYRRSQFNRAAKARRQPGSAFKPFVYLAALEHGYSPVSVVNDQPVRLGSWQPENYRKTYLGAVRLETALALSLNTVAARLVMELGPEAVAAVAHRLGITSSIGHDVSIALGTSEVTLLELTSAFVPFSNGGFPVSPYVVTRIQTRDGRLVYERNGSGFTKAIPDRELDGMNRMMRLVITEGTGNRAGFPGFDIAGKTGTSQNYRDAWFIGYSSELVAGVWVGNDDNKPTRKVTGGLLPAVIWREVMEAAHQGLRPSPLPGGGELSLVDQMAVSDSSSAEKPVGEKASAVQEAPRGFFEQLLGRIAQSQQKPGHGEKGTGLTAFERMKRAQEDY